MRLKALLIVFLYLSLSCSCPLNKFEYQLYTEVNQSTEIYQINVIEIDSENFEISKAVILEKYKGQRQISDTFTIKSFMGCWPIVNTLGKWVVYGHSMNDTFEINSCGLSRHLDSPKNNPYFNVQPVPPPPSTDTSARIHWKATQYERTQKMDSLQYYLDIEAPIIERDYLQNLNHKE